MALVTVLVNEQAVLLGRQHALIGIFARPVADALDSQSPEGRASEGQACEGRPTIVVLNTGIIHRVGHHRMYVAMARTLAAAGYPVLRFDLSGIGDSDMRADALSPLDSVMADIKEALDWIETATGTKRIVLIGLCSGADQSVVFGPTDDRVVGLVLMDPSIPATWQHYLRYVVPRLTRVRSWIDLLTFRSRTVRAWAHRGLDRMRFAREVSDAFPDQRESETIAALYQEAVDKGIRMLAVFTGDPTRQTYREQMIEALPNVKFGDRLQLEYLAGSDHIFVLERDRVWLANLILQWLSAEIVVNEPHGAQAFVGANDVSLRVYEAASRCHPQSPRP